MVCHSTCSIWHTGQNISRWLSPLMEKSWDIVSTELSFLVTFKPSAELKMVPVSLCCATKKETKNSLPPTSQEESPKMLFNF